MFAAALLGAWTSVLALSQDGTTLRLPVTRDTWLSAAGAEADGSNGGAGRLKLKSIQESSLIDVDTALLKGSKRVVTSARLHLRSTGEPHLKRVTVSTISAEWFEGNATNYQPQAGSSTFHHRRHPDVPWSFPGSDLTSVVLGQGRSLWRSADASPPDAEGWQTIAIAPEIVAARVAGLSHGFFLFDDTGSEWTHQGDQFRLTLFPNRFIFSKDENAARAPYVTVTLGREDRASPNAPRDLRVEDRTDRLPTGEAVVSWSVPDDEGPAGTLGFMAQVDDRDAPRYLIPSALSPGPRVSMRLRDGVLKPGVTATLTVRAVDAVGNVGPAASVKVTGSSHKVAALPGRDPAPFEGQGPLPRLGSAEVGVIDELDKVQPETGAMVPPQAETYLAANHLWDAARRRVRLHAARGEFVGFQVLINGDVGPVQPTLIFPDTRFPTTFGRYQAVVSKVGPMPDPIVSLDERRVKSPRECLHAELYVPTDARTGAHHGTLTLVAGSQSLSIDVELTVWDFTLPDFLSFIPEMNCYGLPRDEREFYRLAHRHRTVLNRLPYSQNGSMAEGCAPSWDGKTLDWTAWDRRFGPYLDGSAFADMPRARIPLEVFYLPLHENWPTPMEGNYNGDYWADRAFPPSYREAFVAASAQVARHCREEGWDETIFQGFLNNKNNYKAQGWSRGSSPWLLDEPANFQDYWALRWFAQAFHEGVRKGGPGPERLAFRADISRPEWQRDALDGLLDYNVVSGAFRRYRRIVLDRKEQDGQWVTEYGTSNAIESPNTQPVAWCLDAWCLGADGVIPWQTLGRGDSWERADELALLYPSRRGDGSGPVPSIRLKAYRRGQQDVEYLTLLTKVLDEPRWAIGQAARSTLKLEPRRMGTETAGGGEDAGRVDYGQLRPQDLWKFRVRIGEYLSGKRPGPARRLVDWRPPSRDP
jgi:hypothetical protein